jgi:hypothetical protein
MVKFRITALYMAPSIAIGVIVPLSALYYVGHGLSVLVASILVFFALAAATILGVVGIGVTAETDASDANTDFERVRVLRASQRAMIEELDDIIELLKQIRDSLSPKGE